MSQERAKTIESSVATVVNHPTAYITPQPRPERSWRFDREIFHRNIAQPVGYFLVVGLTIAWVIALMVSAQLALLMRVM